MVSTFRAVQDLNGWTCFHCQGLTRCSTDHKDATLVETVDAAASLILRSEIEHALELLHVQINKAAFSTGAGEIDSMFRGLIASKMDTELIIGILCASFPFRDRLPSRAVFRSESEKVLRLRREWSEELLRGL